MFERFFPDRYVASTYIIDYEKLYEEGVRGLIFDIDNTLVPHGAPADERAVRLFARLKDIGFRCCLISNNQEKRVKTFNEPIRVDYVYNAHKPSVKNYIRPWRSWAQTGRARSLSGTSSLPTCGGQRGQASPISS